MIRILIASYLEEHLVERIRRARPDLQVAFEPQLLPTPRYVGDHTGAPYQRDPASEAAWLAQLEGAEVAFDFDYTQPHHMRDHAPKLRWVQASSAGIGSFVTSTGLDRTPIDFTTAAGVHGRPLAEFVAWACLSAAKDYPLARAQQRERRWKRFHSAEVLGSSLLLIGVGGVGRSVAQLMRSLGVRVVGIKRDLAGADPRELHLDALHPLAELDHLLPEANHVVLACPLTHDTTRMLDQSRFARFTPGTTLVNIGRGGLIVPEALRWGLEHGHVGTAVLDVTDPEPLPVDDPLWRHERVIIFPHSASTSVHENERLVELFIENLHRYAQGRPLRNLYRRELQY